MQSKVVISDSDFYLDITAEVCPMTFVKTRLLLERMTKGQTAEIRLKGEEPLKNVPASVEELGHTVQSIAPETSGAEIYRLHIRKNA